MKFKSKCSALVGFLLFAGLSFGADNIPQECPNISTIKSEGIAGLYNIADQAYEGYTISSYNTHYNWVFVLGHVLSDSRESALEQMNNVLPQLSGNPVPSRMDGKWVCEYAGADEIGGAFAIHYDNMISPQQVLSQFAK